MSDDESSFVCHSGFTADEQVLRRRRASDAGDPPARSGSRRTPSTPLTATSPNVANRTPRMPTPQLGAALMTPQPCKEMLAMEAELDCEIDYISAQFRSQGQPTVTRLTDSIFVGGFPSPADLSRLHRDGVRTVITVCGGSDRIRCIPPECEGLRVVSMNTVDAGDYFILVSDFDDFAGIMDEALESGMSTFIALWE
eukprot:CAMPEP_0174852810 /NCGR_PEP_ID=MMETSP1114-20130205/26872_1 /TAXON_ID=312471 /ORGANISM="Neobodo designis, Strain CCAP 1951/1" /LENGTH=196 /DNA_ID=CAMNT_0016087427 /DNA_START=38 /DNA_END=629 /DNA_ORIENTATION=+